MLYLGRILRLIDAEILVPFAERRRNRGRTAQDLQRKAELVIVVHFVPRLERLLVSAVQLRQIFKVRLQLVKLGIGQAHILNVGDDRAQLLEGAFGGVMTNEDVEVIRKDGTSVEVRIGAEPGDPVLAIPDLLPHLAAAQSQKPLGTAVDPEDLNIFIGSRPYAEAEGSDRIKLAVLALLNEKYGITEEDFLSAELCAVPAYSAVDVGLDRSLLGAYGQDDRVCSYAALKGLFDAEKRHKTAVCILADKEEIGSDGVTGMQSQAFDTFIADLCDSQGVSLRECFEHSFCLSADVTACYDPNFANVYDKRNSSIINRGVGLCKYTGARGKSGASDASAETVGYVRGIFDRAKVIWQIAELGKVDAGGGGTVAMYMANRNITTLDAGVPVLAMHAPFEVVSKLDCYETYKGMRAIYEAE